MSITRGDSTERLRFIDPPKDGNRLFHDQIIFYGFDPFDTLRDFARFLDGLWGINETTQLNGALVSLGADLE